MLWGSRLGLSLTQGMDGKQLCTLINYMYGQNTLVVGKGLSSFGAGCGEPELQGRSCHTESTAPSSDQGEEGITVLFYKTSLRAMGEEIPKVLPQLQQPTINSFGI